MKFAACQSDNVITTTLMHTHTPFISYLGARGRKNNSLCASNKRNTGEREEGAFRSLREIRIFPSAIPINFFTKPFNIFPSTEERKLERVE